MVKSICVLSWRTMRKSKAIWFVIPNYEIIWFVISNYEIIWWVERGGNKKIKKQNKFFPEIYPPDRAYYRPSGTKYRRIYFLLPLRTRNLSHSPAYPRFFTRPLTYLAAEILCKLHKSKKSRQKARWSTILPTPKIKVRRVHLKLVVPLRPQAPRGPERTGVLCASCTKKFFKNFFKNPLTNCQKCDIIKTVKRER